MTCLKKAQGWVSAANSVMPLSTLKVLPTDTVIVNAHTPRNGMFRCEDVLPFRQRTVAENRACAVVGGRVFGEVANLCPLAIPFQVHPIRLSSLLENEKGVPQDRSAAAMMLQACVRKLPQSSI